MIARFASEELRTDEEWPILKEIVGLRFKRIEIQLTSTDYRRDEVQDWIKQLFTRAHYLGKTLLVITVLI